jgi:predicted ATPase
MPNHVKSLHAQGLYGRFDIDQDFESGVNILHGRNGTGKTTLLHVIANTLNRDYRRFAYLRFDEATLTFDDNTSVSLRRTMRDNRNAVLVTEPHQVEEVIWVDDVYKEDQERERQRAERYQSARSVDGPRDRPPQGLPYLGAAYFPAFRTMLEAWTSTRPERTYYRRTPHEAELEVTTSFVRSLFGDFVPAVNYASLPHIEIALSEELFDAWGRVSQVDRELLSSAFLGIFGTLTAGGVETIGSADQLLQEINRLTESLQATPFEDRTAPTSEVYSRLREMVHSVQLKTGSEGTAARVLEVYRNSLAKLLDAKNGAYAAISRYMESLNGFLEGKELQVGTPVPRYRGIAVGLKFADGATARGLRVLSSGERQIATLIYAATHMSKQAVVLIDEPEISLHVDWQRLLVRKMVEQLGNRQIIACTHSPVIGADFEERMKELHLKPTVRPRSVTTEDQQDEESMA